MCGLTLISGSPSLSSLRGRLSLVLESWVRWAVMCLMLWSQPPVLSFSAPSGLEQSSGPGGRSKRVEISRRSRRPEEKEVVEVRAIFSAYLVIFAFALTVVGVVILWGVVLRG